MGYVRKTTIAAQNDVSLVIEGMKGARAGWAILHTGAANPANAEFELGVSWNGVDYFVPDLIDPADPGGASIVKLTGANKAGYARVPGAQAVRAKRLDANGGDGDCSLTVTESVPA